ncbi:hypothetical protein BA195_06755 [Tenacibaculum soleae]|uniref:Uncharacterized protein n=1 Tax=Tenacibaculum soleae TaxID=447689 RepID=A0A1B9Y3T7_9FLAO|nr:hypothetical protein [Tenacibaculum soleae]OCK44371.1 hypothetical protein BA195_06755 [Tenacibaculum soleae]
MNQQQKANLYQLKIKSQLADLVLQIATSNGFLQYYFKILPKCKTQKDAFELVNLIYYLLFNEYKYTGYNSFRQVKNKYLKNGSSK